MKKIDFKEMPATYTLCTCNNCERHETCLHWLAYEQHDAVERTYFYDARWIEQNGGTQACTHYADSTPVEYAAGFQHIFDEIPKAKAEALRKKLLQHFGAYTYYRYRRGEYMMTPNVQEYIKTTAKELGITTDIHFMRRESHINWHDSYLKGDKE